MVIPPPLRLDYSICPEPIQPGFVKSPGHTPAALILKQKSGAALNCPAFLNHAVLLEVGDVFPDNVQQLAAADHLLHLQNIGPNLPVDLVEGDLLTDVLQNSLVDWGNTLSVGPQAAADVNQELQLL